MINMYNTLVFTVFIAKDDKTIIIENRITYKKDKGTDRESIEKERKKIQKENYKENIIKIPFGKG